MITFVPCRLRLLTGAVACLHLLIDMAVTAAVGDLALLGELSTEVLFENHTFCTINFSAFTSGQLTNECHLTVYVSKLPWRASWQDLKVNAVKFVRNIKTCFVDTFEGSHWLQDHMRQAGDVSYAQVFHEAGGKLATWAGVKV